MPLDVVVVLVLVQIVLLISDVLQLEAIVIVQGYLETLGRRRSRHAVQTAVNNVQLQVLMQVCCRQGTARLQSHVSPSPCQAPHYYSRPWPTHTAYEMRQAWSGKPSYHHAAAKGLQSAPSIIAAG